MELQNLNIPADIVAAVIVDQASASPASANASAGGQAAPAAQQQANTAAAGGAGGTRNAGETSQAPGTTAQTARPATYHELKAALQGADATFITSQLDANATVAQAQSAYMAKLASDNQRMSAENAELKKTQEVAAGGATPRKPGVAPVSNLPAGTAAGGSSTKTAGGDAISAWDERIEQLMTDRKMFKGAAVRHLAIEDPDAHRAYIAAYTAENAEKVTRKRE